MTAPTSTTSCGVWWPESSMSRRSSTCCSSAAGTTRSATWLARPGSSWSREHRGSQTSDEGQAGARGGGTRSERDAEVHPGVGDLHPQPEVEVERAGPRVRAQLGDRCPVLTGDPEGVGEQGPGESLATAVPTYRDLRDEARVAGQHDVQA